MREREEEKNQRRRTEQMTSEKMQMKRSECVLRAHENENGEKTPGESRGVVLEQ